MSRVCPTRKPQNGTSKFSTIEFFKEKGSSKGALLSYLLGKVREHDALILFDPGSTHNFISQELALKLGIHDFEMGEGISDDGLQGSKGECNSSHWEVTFTHARLCRQRRFLRLPSQA